MDQIITILQQDTKLGDKFSQIQSLGHEYDVLPQLRLLVYGIGVFQLEFNEAGRLVAI